MKIQFYGAWRFYAFFFPAFFCNSPFLFAQWEQVGAASFPKIYHHVSHLAGNDSIVLTPNLYRTTDKAETWNRMAATGLPEGGSYTYSLQYTQDGEWLAGTSLGLFQSTDGGDSWVSLSTFGTNLVAKSGDTLVSAFYQIVKRSTNNGLDWESATAGLPNNLYVRNLVADNGIFFIQADQQIFIEEFG
ncbi:MAG: hypothetical protein AAB316_15820, partial [Bacteroidota bacterium]